MRKSYFAIIALGALVIASCQKENSADLPKVDSPVFTATLDGDSDTKTVLNGNKSEWRDGDAIRVLNGTNTKGCDAEYTTTDNGTSATFTTTVKGFTGTKFMALYPANMSGKAEWKSDYPTYINKLWLKNLQSAVAGSYDSEAHLAYAYSENSSFSFKNMVSLLKFTIAADSQDVVSISLTVPSGEYIAGNFTYNTAGTGTGTCIKEGDSRLSTVTLTGTFAKGETYYLAVLPGTYSSLDLKVNDRAYRSKTQPSTFTEGKIYDLGEIKVVEEQKKAIVMTIDKQNNWDKLYIYAWDSAENKFFGDWPGTVVEGNTVTFPEEYYKADVNFILHNNALIKTQDQTRTLSDDFSFTLPADIPGSFIVLNCPDWGTHLYIFYDKDSSITLGGWPGVELTSHKLYTYKYYPIDDFIDKSFNFILNGKNNDNQTVQTKNLWTYDRDGWVKKNGCHYYTYDSSKHHN